MYKPFWVLAQLPQSKLQTLRQSQVLTCTLRRDLRTCCPRSPSYQLGQGWRLEGETSSKSPQGQSHPVLDDSRFEGYCRLSGHLELFVQMLPIMCLRSLAEAWCVTASDVNGSHGSSLVPVWCLEQGLPFLYLGNLQFSQFLCGKGNRLYFFSWSVSSPRMGYHVIYIQAYISFHSQS